MKRLLVIPLLLAASGGVLFARQASAPARPGAPSTLEQPGAAFRVVFGVNDAAARDWSGSLGVTGGSLRRLQPWHFEAADAVTGEATWRCRTEPWNVNPRRSFEAHLPDRDPVPLNQPGLLVETSGEPGARVRIRTAAGDFEFR